MKRWRTASALAVLVLISNAIVYAQDLASFEKRVTVHKLPNGLTVVLCRRPEAPVFSFNLFVDSGSAQDPRGKTGIAHMMEHMAFKGTPTIGTTNYAAEKIALQKVESAYAKYRREKLKRIGRNDKLVAQFDKEWKAAMAGAEKYVIKNQFGEIIEREAERA